MLYDGKKVDTRQFQGRFRGLTWDQSGSCLTLVGNAGHVTKLQNDRDAKFDAGTSHSLRSASANPIDNSILAVGNAGTVIRINANGSVAKIDSPTFENLRVVRWNADGTIALIGGNNGALLKYTERGLEAVYGGRANLRGISWRKGAPEALITSNCFAEEFIPSPNLFLFDERNNALKPVGEGRTDLIGVDWNPDGSFAVVVGYDVIWHNAFIGRFDGSTMHPLEFRGAQIYPVAVRWDPTGRIAAIATCIAQFHSGQGRLILWDRETFREICRNENFFFTNIAWSPVGFRLAAIASTEARTFNS